MTRLGLKGNFCHYLFIFKFRCTNALALSLTHSITSNKPFLIKGFRVSYSRVGGMAEHSPNPTFFFENPLSKLMLPMGHPPPPNLKMKLPPSEKQPPPREVPLHEMIPKKYTINNNLKSS